MPDCKGNATEGKPYCIDHLDNLPYVQLLKSVEVERTGEEHRARSPRNKSHLINIQGSRCKEILAQLKVKGAQTPKRLAISTELNNIAIDNFLKALSNAGLIEDKLVGSRRGTPRRVVMLTEAGQAAVDIDIQETSDDAA
jgi:hypothetical protein